MSTTSTACVSSADILGTLGEGGFGKVYKINKNGKSYALKTFKKRDLSAGNLIELDILRRVNHPNVVNAVDVYFSTEGCKVCVLMELATSDLHSLIGSRPLTMMEKIDIMFSLVCGLAYLHANDIIHRDIKPSNVLMFGSTPKIADYGLAVISPTKTHPTSHAGTRNYKAPELLVGYPTFDSGIDVWAMGLTFYELLTDGERIVEGETPEECVQNIVDGIGKFPARLKLNGWNYDVVLPSDPFENIDQPWRGVIKEMLTIDPDKRPNAQTLLKNFGNYKGGCSTPKIELLPFIFDISEPYTDIRSEWLRNAYEASAKDESDLDYKVFFLGVDIADRFFTLEKRLTIEQIELYLPACFSLAVCLLKEDTGDADETEKCKVVGTLGFNLFRPTADTYYPWLSNDQVAEMLISTAYAATKKALSVEAWSDRLVAIVNPDELEYFTAKEIVEGIASTFKGKESIPDAALKMTEERVAKMKG